MSQGKHTVSLPAIKTCFVICFNECKLSNHTMLDFVFIAYNGFNNTFY